LVESTTKTNLMVSIHMEPKLNAKATWLRIMSVFSFFTDVMLMGPMMNNNIAVRT
jgi:hypothetical protein